MKLDMYEAFDDVVLLKYKEVERLNGLLIQVRLNKCYDNEKMIYFYECEALDVYDNYESLIFTCYNETLAIRFFKNYIEMIEE